MVILKLIEGAFLNFISALTLSQSTYCCVISQCPTQILSYSVLILRLYFHSNLFLLYFLFFWNNHRHLRDKIKDKSIGSLVISQFAGAIFMAQFRFRITHMINGNIHLHTHTDTMKARNWDSIINSMVSKTWHKWHGLDVALIIIAINIRFVREIWTSLRIPRNAHTHETTIIFAETLLARSLDHSSNRVHLRLWQKTGE